MMFCCKSCIDVFIYWTWCTNLIILKITFDVIYLFFLLEDELCAVVSIQQLEKDAEQKELSR